MYQSKLPGIDLRRRNECRFKVYGRLSISTCIALETMTVTNCGVDNKSKEVQEKCFRQVAW